MSTEHQESSQEGQPETPAESVVGTAISEEEYRYDPAADPDRFPPDACTISEFVLLSLGVHPRRYLVRPFIDRLGSPTHVVTFSARLGLRLSEEDALHMDGKEIQAATRYDQIYRALVVGVLTKPEEQFGGQIHLWMLRYEDLRNFALTRRWSLPPYMTRGDASGDDTADTDQLSPASQMLRALRQRTGDTRLTNLENLIALYRMLYEEGEGIPLAKPEEVIKEAMDRVGAGTSQNLTTCFTRMLRTEAHSRGGRPRERT